jgi:hypothetical protein
MSPGRGGWAAAGAATLAPSGQACRPFLAHCYCHGQASFGYLYHPAPDRALRPGDPAASSIRLAAEDRVLGSSTGARLLADGLAWPLHSARTAAIWLLTRQAD